MQYLVTLAREVGTKKQKKVFYEFVV